MALPRGNSDRSRRDSRESSSEKKRVPQSRKRTQSNRNEETPRKRVKRTNESKTIRDNREKRSSSNSEEIRSLNKASKEAIKASKSNTGKDKGTLTLDQMRKYVGEQDDFYYDLDKSASLFINKELRTPPDREEMKRIKAARIKQAQEQREALEEILAQQAREDEAESKKQFDYDE